MRKFVALEGGTKIVTVIPLFTFSLPMTEYKVKEIRISSKYHKKFLSAEVKLRDICSQLTLALYGKPLTTGMEGCLGAAQNVQVHKNKDHLIRIVIPSVVWANANEIVDTKRVRTKNTLTKKTVTLKDYFNNVVTHGKSKGLRIETVFT